MRQSHRAGEKLFVDDAGHTVAIVERNTGEVREAQIFVAVLGASNDTFAEATWTQSLVDWCGSHVRVLRFLGGVPELVVPDNLRSAVTKAHRYEPDNNLDSHRGSLTVAALGRRNLRTARCRERKPREIASG
jgi:transposase